jgi:thioredoxin reductase (NADPH)
MATNRPGVFAAGDICTYEGKLKLIATGVGEVCIAVNYAKVYTDPSAKLFPGHSSNMNL